MGQAIKHWQRVLLRLTNKKGTTGTIVYIICSSAFLQASDYKYLGATLQQNLNWSNHIKKNIVHLPCEKWALLNINWSNLRLRQKLLT